MLSQSFISASFSSTQMEKEMNLKKLLISTVLMIRVVSFQAFGQDAPKAVSGRVTSVAVDPSDPSGNTYYVGSANGGVWKTTDGGSSWVLQIALNFVNLL